MLRSTVQEVLVGNRALMIEHGVDVPDTFAATANPSSRLLVARDGRFLGSMAIGDVVRPESRRAIESFGSMDIRSILLTGDTDEVARSVAAELGINEVTIASRRLLTIVKYMANTNQSWDPDAYARNARFVSDLGAPVVDLLAPRAGERILDLGCGDGALTARLAAMGCDVVGVDSSAPQVEACSPPRPRRARRRRRAPRLRRRVRRRLQQRRNPLDEAG